MRCPLARTLMSEYLSNTLNPSTHLELTKHLAECQECQNLLETLRKQHEGSTEGIKISEDESKSSKNTSEIKPNEESASASLTTSKNNGFVPQPSRSTTQKKEAARQRLEEMGILLPDLSSEITNDGTPHAAKQEDISNTAPSPIDQLMSRFQPSFQPSEYVVGGVSSSSIDINPSVSAPEHLVAHVEEKKSASQNITITNQNDKEDEDIWVDIVVTHHVTRQQITRRVRRDSSEARRYFASNPQISANPLRSVVESKPITLSVDKTVLPAYLYPDSTVVKTNEIVTNPEKGQIDIAQTTPPYNILPSNEGASLHRLGISNVFDDTLIPEETVSIISRNDDKTSVEDLSSNSEKAENNESIAENLVSCSGIVEEIDQHDSHDPPEVIDNLVDYIDEKKISENDITNVISDEGLISEEKSSVSPLAEVEALGTHFINHNEDEDEQDDEEFDTVLLYEVKQSAVQERVQPLQHNPIVSRPAEIGRERLERQSRFGRNEQQVIVRDQPKSAASTSFSRMQTVEKMKKNPALLIGLIVLLCLALVFLSGMLANALNSPGAMTKRDLIQSTNLKLDDDCLKLNVFQTQLADPTASLQLEFFDLNEVTPGTRLYAQLIDINRFYASIMFFGSEKGALTYRDNLDHDTRSNFDAQLSLVIQDLQSKAQLLPVSDAEWQITGENMEPVVTLALIYGLGYQLEEPITVVNGDSVKDEISAVFGEKSQMVKFYNVISIDNEQGYLMTEVLIAGVNDYSRYLVLFDQNSFNIHSLYLFEGHGASLSLSTTELHVNEWENLAARFGYHSSTYFMIGCQVKTTDTVYYFAPLIDNYVRPSVYLQISMDEFNNLYSAYSQDYFVRSSLISNEVADPKLDIFSAIAEARRSLNIASNEVIKETVLPLDLTGGAYGSDRLAWLYRCFFEGESHTIVVEDNLVQSFSWYLPQ